MHIIPETQQQTTYFNYPGTSTHSTPPAVLMTCFLLGILEHAVMQIIQTHFSGAGGTGVRAMQCQGFAKDMVLEVKHETCTGSEI